MTTPSLSSQSSRTETGADFAHLQGDWLTIEGRRAGELFITGRTYTIQFMDGTFYKGTFDMVPDRSPSVMIMHIEEGPPKHKGKTAWCLYALEVGQLRWCPSEPGSDDRLADFPPMSDPRYLHTIFRRDIVDSD
jgi:uncharacterized protein (TIGR03067 family)